MKKLAIILVILCLTVAAIPAGAENEKDWMLGRWTLCTIADLDAEGNITATYAAEEFGIERDMYFGSDGTGFFSISNYGILQGSSPFQWYQDAASPYELMLGQELLITYDESSKEIKVPSDNGVEALLYRKTDWPVQKPAKKEAEKIQDYYGVWELCAVTFPDSVIEYDYPLDSKLFDKLIHAYIIIAENDLYIYLYGSLYGEKVNYSVLHDLRVKDGCLQAKLDNEYHDTIETVENGWILFQFSGMDMYFEKMDDSISLEQVLDKIFQDAAGQDNSAAAAPETNAEPAAASSQKVRVNEGSNPNVRSQPSADSQKVGTARSGKTYELLDERNGWYKIRLEDGTEGWISGGMASVVSQ